MTTAQIEIRRLTETDAADAAKYRAIRLEALEANPEAFGSTVEMESAQPLSWFSDRLANSTVLGGFRDGELVATAGFVVQQGSKNSHKGTIWGLYVRPDARSTGTARRLVEAILDLARHRVELVQLTVVQENAKARQLYESLGFVQYGCEKKGLKHEGRYYDEILMAKDICSAT